MNHIAQETKLEENSRSGSVVVVIESPDYQLSLVALLAACSHARFVIGRASVPHLQKVWHEMWKELIGQGDVRWSRAIVPRMASRSNFLRPGPRYLATRYLKATAGPSRYLG